MEKIGAIPVVSVIIPVYNIEKYIRRSVESVINQTHKQIQIIIVNDGSTDGSDDICTDLVKKDQRIVYIRHDVNKGQTITRNDGVATVSGDWMMFLDGDDVLEPSAISQLLDAVRDNETDIVFAGYKFIDYNNSIDYLADIDEGTYTRREFINHLFDDISESILSCIGSKLYRSSFIKNRKEHTSNKITTNYDMAFVIDALLACRKVAYINQPIYGYIQRKNSITYSYRNDMYARVCVAREKIPLLIKDSDFYEEKNLLFQRKQLSLIISTLKQEILFKKGYVHFRKCINEICESDEFLQIYNAYQGKNNEKKRLLYIALIKQKRCFTLYILHKMLIRINIMHNKRKISRKQR